MPSSAPTPRLPSPSRTRSPRAGGGWLALTFVLAACTATSEEPGSSRGGSGGGGNAGSGSGGAGGVTAGASGAAGGAGGSSAASGGAGSGGGAGQTGGGGSAGPGGGGAAGSGGAGGSGAPGGAGSAGSAGLGGTGPAAGATGDAAVESPSASGPCGAKLCDDFEGYAAGSVPAGSWTAATTKGAIAVDERKAWSGARSVRFTHQGAPAKAFLELRQPVLPLPGHVMHGRLMFHLTAGPTGQYTHWEIVRGSGLLAGGRRAQYNTGGENGKFVVNYEPNDCTKYSKVDFPQKRWACYQWEFNGPRNEIKMWIDGQAITDLPVAPTAQCWTAPMTFDTVHVGWEAYHGTQPLELWIDDIAVGDAPIPCPTGQASKP